MDDNDRGKKSDNNKRHYATTLDYRGCGCKTLGTAAGSSANVVKKIISPFLASHFFMMY
jgi:hypothetical protein